MQEAVKENFIRQQGFDKPAGPVCSPQFSALQFQPRIVMLWIILGIITQYWAVFVALAVLLWWNALLPALNPFDAIHNRLFAKPSGYRLGLAPPPRRTAQTMAGVFALACGLFLYLGYLIAAYVVEGIFLAAVLALTLGGFCLGSFVYHLIRGQFGFAMRTLPWSRPVP